LLAIGVIVGAIASGSGQVTVPQMMCAGFRLTILAVLLIMLYLPWVLHLVLG